jgi:hypothetical protein
MTESISATVKAVLVVAVLAVAAVVGYEWLQEHDALTKAQATQAVEQKTVDAAKADAQTTAAALDARLKVLEAERQQPATAPQIVLDASKLFPSLPQPLQVVTPPPTQTVVAGKTVEVPSAPVVQVPQVDFAALQAGAITCQEDDAKLAACTKTAADSAAELKATTAQRDQWQSAAKGGTLLHRLATAGKWFSIGGGVVGGTVAIYEQTHKK